MKLKLKYYNIIFFNTINKNCFLETLEKNTITQMLNNIKEDEKKVS